jgi:hypothetical protein
MTAQYGTKDLMRILDIQKKSDGDLYEAFKLAVRMAGEIEEPGKALARGYASIEVYKSLYSPIAGVFFTRACDLSGENDIRNIRIMASMNSVGDDEEAIEVAFSRIPIEKQPASRRPVEARDTAYNSNKIGYSSITSLAKINVVKGTGPGFDLKIMKNGTVEVWKNPEQKIRLIYTGSSVPLSGIHDQKDFKFDGKRETWTMVDYIEVYNMMNLQPLYGTSITGFMYN